ncbi:MAG: tRNA (guanosine(46)-N7)-methyltransferase TrmB [Sphingomonadales bacterium]|jgi:tRNA (guanine-N7-)-methyltransferase
MAESAKPPADPTTIRRLYGRRQGHALRQGQAALFADLLPAIEVPKDGPITAAGLFGDDRPLWLEIGFGKGEHMAGQAAMHPQVGIIGAEPFVDGVVGALVAVDAGQLPNVRIHHGDALDVLDRLPDASCDRVFLLHPDPWPKARHAKRRFMNPGPINAIARVLKPGGEFRFGTDHPIYCRWALMQMNGRSDFRWLGDTAADFLTRPADWPQTRYEAKARRLGHEVWYFRWQRL